MLSARPRHPSIAVLVPCLDEEAAVGDVVRDFRAALPEATVYVYDNGSTDRTVEVAAQAGAVVRRERLRGKGHVVRRMFADVESDVYVLVDGDGTYDAAASRGMIERLLADGLDMVSGIRVADQRDAYRAGHRLGNRLLTGMVARIFGAGFSDMLSGYRVLTRRFVKSFPAVATGFETETELTVHALELRMPFAEVPTRYRGRCAGSASKLNTYRDGVRILGTIVKLAREERPLQFFGIICLALIAIAIALALPIFQTYERTGLVPRLPTAVLATGICILGFLSLTCGLVLDTVTRGRREVRHLHYLAERPLASEIGLAGPDGAPSGQLVSSTTQRRGEPGSR